MVASGAPLLRRLMVPRSHSRRRWAILEP